MTDQQLCIQHTCCCHDHQEWPKVQALQVRTLCSQAWSQSVRSMEMALLTLSLASTSCMLAPGECFRVIQVHECVLGCRSDYTALMAPL